MNANKRKPTNFESTFSVRIPKDVLAQVDESARIEGRTRANYIRKLIIDAMKIEA